MDGGIDTRKTEDEKFYGPLCAGYRADFFFGAMDGGIDTLKTEDEKFYGPFATISIGLAG